MYWAVRTTICSALRSGANRLPYQAKMQPVKMLSVVHLLHLLSLLPLPSLHLDHAQEEREPAGEHRAIITYSYINRTYSHILQRHTKPMHACTLTHTPPRRIMLYVLGNRSWARQDAVFNLSGLLPPRKCSHVNLYNSSTEQTGDILVKFHLWFRVSTCYKTMWATSYTLNKDNSSP